MKKIKILLIIIGVVVLYYVLSFLNMKFDNNVKQLKSMTLSQADLNQKESNMYTLFSSGNTSVFDVMVKPEKVNSVIFSIEELKDGQWNSLTTLSFPVSEAYNRMLVDCDFIRSARFSVGSLNDGVLDTRVDNYYFPDDFRDKYLDTSSTVYSEITYGVDYDIVEDNVYILQLKYTGNNPDEKLDGKLFKGYNNIELFSNYKDVFVVTVRFTKN